MRNSKSYKKVHFMDSLTEKKLTEMELMAGRLREDVIKMVAYQAETDLVR